MILPFVNNFCCCCRSKLRFAQVVLMIYIEHSQSLFFSWLLDKADDGSSHKADRREEETVEHYFFSLCNTSKKISFSL